jgi:ankyrin repeat protein
MTDFLKGYENETFLTLECKSNNIKAVRNLIKRGVDLNKPNKLNEYPVVIATKLKHIHLLHLLLENGASPNVPQTIESPLYILIPWKYDEIIKDEDFAMVKLLLSYGANPNCVYVSEGICDEPLIHSLLTSVNEHPQFGDLFICLANHGLIFEHRLDMFLVNEKIATYVHNLHLSKNPPSAPPIAMEYICDNNFNNPDNLPIATAIFL